MKIVEQFMYFGTTINNARYTPEIKSIATAAFTTKKSLFTRKMDLNIRKKIVNCNTYSTAF
jgi:hypothetical protein